MLIINRADSGKSAYVVSVQTGFAWSEDYQVHADSEEQAKERLADFLSEHKCTNLYYEQSEIKALLTGSKYKSEDEFVAAHNLECRGHDKIFVEFISVKMI